MKLTQSNTLIALGLSVLMGLGSSTLASASDSTTRLGKTVASEQGMLDNRDTTIGCYGPWAFQATIDRVTGDVMMRKATPGSVQNVLALQRDPDNYPGWSPWQRTTVIHGFDQWVQVYATIEVVDGLVKPVYFSRNTLEMNKDIYEPSIDNNGGTGQYTDMRGFTRSQCRSTSGTGA